MQVSPAVDVSFGIDPESKGSLRTGLGWRFAVTHCLDLTGASDTPFLPTATYRFRSPKPPGYRESGKRIRDAF